MGASPSATTFQRPDLGLVFEQFDLDDMGFVGLQAAPAFDVARQTANFSKLAVVDLLMDHDLTRSPGSGYSRADYQFSQDNYATVEYGAEEPIDDRERSIYSYSFDIERVAARRLAARILRNLEKKIATEMQDTATNFTGAKTGAAATLWSTTASAAPIKDVETGLIALRANSGLDPDQAVGFCDWKLFLYLKNSTQIKEVIKYSGIDDPKSFNLTRKAIAHALGLKDLIVARGVKNTADKGQAVTIAPIWGADKFTIAIVPRSQDLREPCVARTIAWTGDGASEAGVMEEYRDEPNRSQIIRCRSDFQVKVLYTSAGYVITGCS